MILRPKEMFMILNPRKTALTLSFLALSSLASAAEKPRIEVEEWTMSNGMKWLLFERHDAPTIASGWVAHVGSANERPGITGISHFFEHMMFKGTHTIGTKDIAKDLKLIDEQEQLRGEMRKEMSEMRARLRRGEIASMDDPAAKTARYKELEANFDASVLKQRDNIIKDQMDQIYTKNGGEFLNASTNEDWTVYFMRLPKNKLELWAWIESDRLLNPVFREFYSERDVVFEERRLRTESTPLGKFDEEFNSMFWDAHPYGWPVVGWASDIPMYTLQQAKDYFATYYAPNNITGVLVGDFKTADVKPLLERYFGRLKRGPVAPEVVTLEPRSLGEKRFNAEAETSPTVRVWWQGVPMVHKDFPALDIMTDILSGRTGRLTKSLVLDKKIANNASAFVNGQKYGGFVGAEVTVKDGQEPSAVEAALYEVLDKLKTEVVPDEELQKVKNQAKANAYRRLSSGTFIMFQLLQNEGTGDWKRINTQAEDVDAVTAADIQRVAKQYLTKETRAVGTFTRKAPDPSAAPAAEDPDIEALPEQARPMAKQALAQLKSAKDVVKLRAQLEQMRGQAAQVPSQMRPLMDLLLKRGEERLAELEKEGKK
ncbi:MAG: insulinase family protein [Vicinamibacteria bacterium]|nr:insulinase family protein [Vicinamibacteria bacterium]